MRVAIDGETGGAADKPTTVYTGTFGQSEPEWNDFAVSPDGRILLVTPEPAKSPATHIHVLLNWHLQVGVRVGR